MNLLETVLKAGGGNVVQQLSKNFNLDSKQASSALGALLPMLSQGVKKNMGSENGTQALLGALSGGSHKRYLEDSNDFSSQDTAKEGNSILGHLLGSKEGSRNAAQEAANKTGIDVSILKKMLPAAATLTMGALSKQASSNNLLGAISGAGKDKAPSGASSLLFSFLDADKDGSSVDDVMGFAKKFFK